MKSLKMKIVDFDAINSTLYIKFASDLAEKPIDKYEAHKFNVMEQGDDVELRDIVKALAQNGWNIALQQELAEQNAKDNEKVQKYKSLVNEEFDYLAEELFFSEPTVPAKDQPLSEGLMVI
jgi:hypothetical protein